jgi:hypothetical protein
MKKLLIFLFFPALSLAQTQITGSAVQIGGLGDGSPFGAFVNNIILHTQGAVNFADSSTVTWTNTSGFTVQANVIGSCTTTDNGYFQLSNGHGGCISSPADYGVSFPLAYTFPAIGTGVQMGEADFNVNLTENATAAYSAGVYFDLEDNAANTYGAQYNYLANSEGDHGAFYLIDLTGGVGAHSANWELDTSTGNAFASHNAADTSANMFINLVGGGGTNALPFSNSANFEVSTVCDNFGTGCALADFDLVSSGPSSGNFIITTQTSGHADSGNFEVDTTATTDGGGTASFDLAKDFTINAAAGLITLVAASDTSMTLNTEVVCTASNGECPTGLSNPMAGVGDTIYGGVSGVPTKLAGSISASTLCLTQTGTGSASAAPVWGSCAGSTATAFSALTGSTNTSAAMVVGTGASIAATGSGSITATAAPASGLTGSTLASGVTGSSLTSVGTIGTGVWHGTGITVPFGGTGVATLTGPIKGNGTSAFSAAAAADIFGLWSGSCSSSTYLRGDGACATPAGAGSVTSVGLATPAEFIVSGSPVTGSGTLTFTKASQSANLIYAGPSSGSAAAPTFRALVSADLPTSPLATNIAGGALGSLPYQTNTNVTGFLASPTTAGQTFIPAWQPGGSIIAPIALNLGTYLASPPPIGGTAPNSAKFTSINNVTLIANTQFTVGTTTVNANSCNLLTAVTMSGVTSTTAFLISPASDISAVSGWGSTGGLSIVAWPTTNTLQLKVCNATSANITPSGSATFNVGAK